MEVFHTTLIFLHKKGKEETQITNFSFIDPELAQMTLDWNHDTPSFHKQSLCIIIIGTSDDSL